MLETGRTRLAQAASDEAIAVLASCLRLDRAECSGLAERIAALGWDRLLTEADRQRLGNVLAVTLQQRGLVPPVPAMQLPDGRFTVPAALAQRRDAHVGTRASLRILLLELVAALNSEGIEPMLLKGSRSLWLDTPGWRAMRDIDLLVPRDAVARAQKAAMRLGFRELGGVPLGHHHMPNLYRDDVPGWIELHHRAGVAQLEILMPTRELWDAASRFSNEAGSVYLPPQAMHILHSMLHHHVGHWWDRHTNNISMKGLYEFAAETVALDDAGRHWMAQRAARHPRILAILDLWVAAAADLFGMPVAAGLSLTPDATLWWSKRLARLDDLPRTPALARPDELAAATRAGRLARVEHWLWRHRWPAWLATRWSFVQRPRLLRIILRRAPAP